MLLYDNAISGNCYKVRLLFSLLGIEYERREVSVIDRSNRAELLGALNPGLRVPTLVLDDGRPLAESDAILVYFGEGTGYLPEDRYERAQVLQWMFFEQYSHEPYIAVNRYLMHFAGEGDPRRDHLAFNERGAGGGLHALRRKTVRRQGRFGPGISIRVQDAGRARNNQATIGIGHGMTMRA